MAGHSTTDYADANNLLSGTAGTLEAIRETNSRYEFGIKWAGADAAASVDASPNHPSVGLVCGTFPASPDFGAQAYKNGFSWADVLNPYALISIDWAPGTLAGTIKEKYYGCTFDGSGLVSGRTLVATRDNIDPGYGAIGAGRRGQQYSLAVTGTEFRIYNSREATAVYIQASQPFTAPFPYSLAAWVIGAAGSGFNVPDIRIFRTRPNEASTIYSARDRAADGISSGLHIRIFQNPTPPLTIRGVTTDVDIS